MLSPQSKKTTQVSVIILLGFALNPAETVTSDFVGWVEERNPTRISGLNPTYFLISDPNEDQGRTKHYIYSTTGFIGLVSSRSWMY